jgi:hypothetical protein
LPEPLLADVREHVARVDREITDGYERMAVITYGGGLLGRAGLWSESDALLKSNLTKTLTPYYLMSQLGSNARKLGQKEEALRWYAQAWDKSEGPATRVQWGGGYVAQLIELAPTDVPRIEKAASKLLTEAARDPGIFQGRSGQQLQRLSGRLLKWGAEGKPAATVARLQTTLNGVCGKVQAADGQRAACQALLKAPAKKAAA